jgi:hypothetical protein
VVIRRGFAAAPVEVLITGHGTKTMGPRIVHRDLGHGLAFVGPVEHGQSLVFERSGRVTLDTHDVTDRAFAWQGACFADADEPSPNDFVFGGADGRSATFAVASPFDALDPSFAFPHGGAPIPMPEVSVGTNRFAFWVQQAHASHRQPDLSVRPVQPRTQLGEFDASVFADADNAKTPRADVGFAWDEHEAYAVKIWIPARFEHFEPSEGASLRNRLAAFLGRFKAAGVDLRVEYIDEHWILDEGILGDLEGEDLLARLRPGVVLNPSPDDE